MTIVLSICVKRDDSHCTYYLVSQSQLVLRDIDNFIVKRNVALSFTKLNMVCYIFVHFKALFWYCMYNLHIVVVVDAL